jgi:hypothetical protein
MHSLPRNQEEVINDFLREYKRKLDNKELEVEFTDDLEAPVEISYAEISIINNKVQVKKLLKDKADREEKRELQKIKKEWEDR